MRYASAYSPAGQPVVTEVRGDLLVPLAGLTEVGSATGPGVLAAAERLPASAFPATEAIVRPVVPNPAKILCVGLSSTGRRSRSQRSTC